MLYDYSGKAVLVTGGTRGIGLATGLEFARRGARCWLTHRWGSADEAEVARCFAEAGAPAPVIAESDASVENDIPALLDRIRAEHPEGVAAFVSNVGVAQRGEGVEELSRRALFTSIKYTSWPFVAYLHALRDVFGRYPRYAVATSSDGPDCHYPHYDYVAVSKAVLETLARYMSMHLRDEGVLVNVVRTRQVPTESYEEMFGRENVELAGRFPEFAVTPGEVGATIFALCSGLMDAMSGQVVQLDRGAQFVDNVFTLGPRLLGGSAPGGSR
jgi:NAD(P)-dependent dehydrogenase (short-subunit alcohol dehydrogenase family)